MPQSNVHGNQGARAALFGNQKTDTINREHKTAVLIGFDIAYKRGSGADFDNHNNTTSQLPNDGRVKTDRFASIWQPTGPKIT